MEAETMFDKQGDKFFTHEKKGYLYIELRLASETHKRDVGRVRLKDRVLELVRQRDKHLMRKNNSYGFNEYMVRNGRTFDTIELSDEKGTYSFPKELVMEKGSYLHFKQEGYEKQLFVPLDELLPYTIKNKL